MSHVDEGALHAYLDGALDEYPADEAERIRDHLDRCAECADRLEVERRVRSDAHAMLGLAAPEVEAPSFEELRAYVERTRRRRSGVTRLQRLGWAASVVLALGAGWMLREGQLQSRGLDIGQDRVTAPAAATSRPVGEAAGRAAEAEGLTAAAEQAVAPGGSVSAEQFARRADLPAAPVAKAGEVGQEARAGEPAPVMNAAVDELAVEPDAADVAVATDLDTMSADSFTGLRVADMEVLPGVQESVADVTAGAGAAAPSTVRAAPGETVAAATEEARRRRAEAAAPVVSAPQAAPGAVEGLEDEERALPAEPRISVPGHEVLDVANLGEGTAPWGARVLQRHPDGVTFEVIHLEPGVDPSILSAAEAGHGEARAETEAGWVLVRGPLADAQLEDLLRRLLPGAR